MAVFEVTNSNDNGAGSFRQAIADANALPGKDTVALADNLSGAEIVLTSGQVEVRDDLEISFSGLEVPSVRTVDSSPALFVDGNNIDDELLEIQVNNVTIVGDLEFRETTATTTIEVVGSDLSNELETVTVEIVSGFEGDIRVVTGTSLDDVLAGAQGNDSLAGGDGNDILFANGGGEDTLLGGSGDDILVGDNSRPFVAQEAVIAGLRDLSILNGGEGNDILIGGIGQDEFVLEAGQGIDTIFNYQQGIDTISLRNGSPDELQIVPVFGGSQIELAATGEILAISTNPIELTT